jgi:hypothetical protein
MSYLMISLDVGGQSDPAAIVAMSVRTVDRLIKAQVHYLAIKPPIVTPTAHLTFVDDTLKLMRRQIGIAPVRVVVDVSSNSGIANLLAQALPKNSMVAIRISGGDAHGAGVTAFPIGDVGGKATALPALTLSRRQMLLDVGQALSSRLLTLPVDDKEQAEGLAALKSQMSRASLKVTASGRQVAVVQRSHDDLLMALAMAWIVASRLPGPRSAATRDVRPSPSALAWT